ncbi:hypothetical protein GPALN_011600 [Globodera pallida]|nr:hypothetical protein GPALN_011600 [Globodera pallida]
MMKLRTKSQTNLSLPDEQTPSTSSSSAAPAAPFMHGMRRLSTNSNNDHHQHSSPDSPVIGRIAKSNARILNGLDLNVEKRSGGVCVDVFGILPDLKTDELNVDRYPHICNFLETGRKSLDVETLHLMQHELEELISLNVDSQKTIHGEITYMTTGEYPTIDLARRLMPKYELLKKREQQKLRKRCEQTPELGLADLGILSSPEEDEAPNILDVPNRFWTWAKEYLRPISKATVREFKDKLFDRFVGAHYTSRCHCAHQQLQHPTTLSSTNALTPHPNKAHKRKSMDGRKSAEQTPVKMLKLDKSSYEAYVVVVWCLARNRCRFVFRMECKKVPVVNNCCTAESAVAELLASTTGATKIKQNGIIVKKNCGVLEAAPTTPAKDDEVSMELYRKQQQLKMLFDQTEPVVKQLHARLQVENAVHEVFKRLDSADTSLLQLGSKYEKLHLFNSEQRLEAEQTLSMHSKVYKMFNG